MYYLFMSAHIGVRLWLRRCSSAWFGSLLCLGLFCLTCSGLLGSQRSQSPLLLASDLRGLGLAWVGRYLCITAAHTHPCQSPSTLLYRI